jgi:PhnB protein
MPSIAPILSVRRGAQAIEFYKTAFGAVELFRIEDEIGSVVAQLSAGTAEFWVADESPGHLNFSPESLGGGSVRMLLIADDPDGIVRRYTRMSLSAAVVATRCSFQC